MGGERSTTDPAGHRPLIALTIIIAVMQAAGISATLLGKFIPAIVAYCVGSAVLLSAWLAVELPSLRGIRENRLWRLSLLCILMLVIGIAEVGAGMWTGVYITDGPFEILVPVSAAAIGLTIALAAWAPRSASAYWGCIAILLTVGAIASYCAFAMLELGVELPQLWAVHFMTPSLLHVFNVMLTTGMVVYATISLLGLLGLIVGRAPPDPSSA